MSMPQAKLYTHRSGNSGLNVILEAGAGDCHLTWSLVQPELSKHHTVLSYDRAGLGCSERSCSKRQLSHYVRELKHALNRENFAPPYILVGHSLGGLIMLYYALKYPHEVAGIVLVDAAHEAQMQHPHSSVKKYIKLIKCLSHLSWLGIPRLLTHFVIPKKIFSAKLTKQYRRLQSTKKSLSTLAEELTMYANDVEPFLDKLKTTLNNTPIVVISRSQANHKSISKSFDEFQKELQKEFLSLSTKSKHIIAEKSNHMIHWTEPELIIDAVRWINAG